MRMNLKFYLVALLLAAAFVSCEESKTLPKVSTLETVSEITSSSSVIGGNVTGDGGADITAMGIAWSTNQNPTLSDSYTEDPNPSVGPFSHLITGLEAGTTYYARAYATNSEGTSYGSNVSFTTTDATNFLTYDGVTYPLAGGFLDYYGKWYTEMPSYNFDLTLYSSGLTWVEQIEYFTGTGHAMYFEMFTTSQTNLASGVYSYDFWETYEANTFDYGFFLLNFNAEQQTAEVDSDITGGTITVVTSGNDYQITVDCTDSFDKSLTAYYEGTLSIYDWSKSFKSTSFQKRVIRIKK